MDVCAGLCCGLPMLLIIMLTILAIFGSMRDSASWKKAKEESKKNKVTTTNDSSYIYKRPKTKYIVEVEDVSDGKL